MKVVLSLVSTERSNHCLVIFGLFVSSYLVCSALLLLLLRLAPAPVLCRLWRHFVPSFVRLLRFERVPVALLRRFLAPALARRVGVGFSLMEFWAGLGLGLVGLLAQGLGFLALGLGFLALGLGFLKLTTEIGLLGLGFVLAVGFQHKAHHQTVMALMPVPLLVPVMRRHPLNLGGQGAFVYRMDSHQAHPRA